MARVNTLVINGKKPADPATVKAAYQQMLVQIEKLEAALDELLASIDQAKAQNREPQPPHARHAA